ncbi:MAG: hypothetical protein HY952_02600 [Elusimicrobia bacterium]|nr:hypothetical protein [Elusimicrobiota bacterium]
MKKLFTAVFLLFLALTYGAVTGHAVLCATAGAKTVKAKPASGGPDDTDDGSGGGADF